MKQLLKALMIVTFFIGCSSCSKEQPEYQDGRQDTEQTVDPIVGKWTTFAGFGDEEQETGVIEYSADGTIKLLDTDGLTLYGKWSITDKGYLRIEHETGESFVAREYAIEQTDDGFVITGVHERRRMRHILKN